MTQAEINSAGYWFQNVTFPGGLETRPGFNYPKVMWDEALTVLPDVRGKTVLDVGCGGGYAEVELERMGATVTAIDNEPMFVRQAELIKKEFGLSCEVFQADVHDLDDHDQLKGRCFDLVLLFGVIYHVENPVLALQNCMAKTKQFLILETAVSPLQGSVAEFLNFSDWDRYVYTWHLSADCLRNLIRYAGGVIDVNFVRPSAPPRQFFKISHGKTSGVTRLHPP